MTHAAACRSFLSQSAFSYIPQGTAMVLVGLAVAGLSGCGGGSESPPQVAQVPAQPAAAQPAAPEGGSPPSSPMAPAAADSTESTDSTTATGESEGSSTSTPEGYGSEYGSSSSGYPGGSSSSGENSSDGSAEMSTSGSSYEEEMRSQYGANGQYGSGEGGTDSTTMSSDYGSYGSSGGAVSPAALKPSGPPKLKFPNDYRGQAAFALSQGLDQEAFNLFMAHLATEPEAAAEDYKKVIFSDHLKRPVWGLRWGIGMAVVREAGFSGNPFPPVDNMQAPLDRAGGNASSGSGSSDSMMESRTESTSSPAAAAPLLASGLNDVEIAKRLEEQLGLVATTLGDQFSTRYQAGHYGTVFPTLVQSNEFATAYLLEGKPGATPNPSFDSSMSSSPTSSEAMTSEMMSSSSSERQSSDFNQSYGQGQGGPAGTAAKKDSSRFVGVPPTIPAPMAPHYRPGLTYVEGEALDQLLPRAKELKLHFLIECLSRVEKNRQGVVTNTIRVRLIDVATGEAIVTGKKIDNVAIYKELQAKRSTPKEDVDEALANFFSYIDAKLKGRPMPTLTPEVARTRVATLLTSPPENRLDVLAEVRMYHAAGQITDEDLWAAFDILMGPEGLTLIAGTKAQMQTLLEPFAPRFNSAM